MEKGQQSSHKSPHFDGFFQSLVIQQWAIDQFLEHLKIPFRIIFGQHNLLQSQFGPHDEKN